MKVSIRSGSAAVRRSLADLVRIAGHEVDDAAPSLVIEDGLHAAPPADHATPRLVISAPVRPSQLARDIGMKLTAQPQMPLASGWRLTASTRQLTHTDMAPIALTEKECLLLSVLARLHPQPVSREALLKEVWAYDEDVETHTLETHVYRLRAKLGALHPKPCDVVTLDASYRLVKE